MNAIPKVMSETAFAQASQCVQWYYSNCSDSDTDRSDIDRNMRRSGCVLKGKTCYMNWSKLYRVLSNIQSAYYGASYMVQKVQS